MTQTIEARNEQYRIFAMSKNELSSEITLGARILALIGKEDLEGLYSELKNKELPKAVKEALLGYIRHLETKLGVEPKAYNGGD